MSNSNSLRGIKYTIGDGRWVTDEAVDFDTVSTIDQFINYLATTGTSVPNNCSITMNLQTVNRNASLSATSGGRPEDDGFVFLSFMQDNKTGGKIAR